MWVRVIAGLLVAGSVLVTPAAGQAGVRVDYKHAFTTPVPGASTGMDAQILFKHPGDPNAKPIPLRRQVITFPEGTTWDTPVVPDCTAPDLELQLTGQSACPPDSWIGAGHGNTYMTGFRGDGEKPITVSFFAGDSAPRALSEAPPLGLRFVTRLVRRGRVVTVEFQRFPGGPPDGELALRRVHEVFPPRSTGARAYLRTPAVCPETGVWRFEGRWTFADGAVEDETSSMPCQRKASGARIQRDRRHHVRRRHRARHRA